MLSKINTVKLKQLTQVDHSFIRAAARTDRMDAET